MFLCIGSFSMVGIILRKELKSVSVVIVSKAGALLLILIEIWADI